MTDFFLSPRNRETYIINLLQSLNNDEDLLVRSIGESVNALNKLQPLEAVEVEQQEATRKLYQHILDRYERRDNDGKTTRRKYSTDHEEGDSVGTSNDNCEVCNEPGHLICCSTCPMVFHLDCVRPVMRSVPKGDWSCPFCHVAGINVVKRGRRLSRDNACQGIEEMRALAKERGNPHYGTGEAVLLMEELRNNKSSNTSTSTSARAKNTTKHNDKHAPAKEQPSPVAADTSNTGKKRPLESSSSPGTERTTPTTTPGSTRSKRSRKQPTLYDPQLGAASSWKTDGAAEWRYVSKDYNCSLCHDSAEITVCPYCGCRACFGKHKEESIILCDGIGCDAEYHLHCLSPPLRKVPSVQWFCPGCKRARAANKESSLSGSSSTPNYRARADKSKYVSKSTKSPTKVAIVGDSSNSKGTRTAPTTTTEYTSAASRITEEFSSAKKKQKTRGTDKHESSTEKRNSLTQVQTQTQSASSNRTSAEVSGSSIIIDDGLDRREQPSIAGKRETKANMNDGIREQMIVSEKQSNEGGIRKEEHEVQSTGSTSTSTPTDCRNIEKQQLEKIRANVIDTKTKISRGQTEDGSFSSNSKAPASKPTQEVSLSSIPSSNIKSPNSTGQPQLRSRSGRVVKKKTFYIEEDEGEQHLKSLRYATDQSKKPQKTTTVNDQKQATPNISNKNDNSSLTSTTAEPTSFEKKGSSVSQKPLAGKEGASPAPAPPGPPGNALGNMACAMPPPYDLPGLMKRFPVPFNVDFSRPPNVTMTKPEPKPGASESNPVDLGQKDSNLFDISGTVAHPPIAPVTATSPASSPTNVAINPVAIANKDASAATTTPTSHTTSSNERNPPQTFLSPITGQPLSKEPRRKPGARECMQISRRFGVKVVPQKYMDILLDYCSRGKLEHLIRMRERLDDHSKLLEYQLAALEDLIREKGAQFSGEVITSSSLDAGEKKSEP